MQLPLLRLTVIVSSLSALIISTCSLLMLCKDQWDRLLLNRMETSFSSAQITVSFPLTLLRFHQAHQLPFPQGHCLILISSSMKVIMFCMAQTLRDTKSILFQHPHYK